MSIELSVIFIITHTAMAAGCLAFFFFWLANHDHGAAAFAFGAMALNALALVVQVATFDEKIEKRVVMRVEQIQCEQSGRQLLFDHEGEFVCVGGDGNSDR